MSLFGTMYLHENSLSLSRQNLPTAWNPSSLNWGKMDFAEEGYVKSFIANYE